MDSFKEVLQEIVRISGKEILKDRKKLLAYLSDMGPEHKREIHIFRRACTDEIIQIILQADKAAATEQQAVRRARHRLVEEEGVAEAWADMLVEALVYALEWKGIKVSKQEAPKAQNPKPSTNRNFEKQIIVQHRDINGEITDSWEEIFAAVEAEIYRKIYRIGDTKRLDLGAEGCVHMQIAAFDTDELADGSGTAAITWISKELLKTVHRMNPFPKWDGDKFLEGTGMIGGWEKSEMRAYMNESILPCIPSDVRNRIRRVIKTQEAALNNAISFKQITEDDVWIPDCSEVFGTDAAYRDLFPDNESRIKHIVGRASARWWWLRTAYSSTGAYAVGSSGSDYINGVYNSGAVPLGFCT